MFKHDRPIEYSILRNVTPTGCAVGTYAGQEISETVADEFGRRFAYVGIALRKRNGQFDANALGPGEFIVLPGLVYRYEPEDSSWWATLFGAGAHRDKAA
jgi:hypothetical protein